MNQVLHITRSLILEVYLARILHNFPLATRTN